MKPILAAVAFSFGFMIGVLVGLQGIKSAHDSHHRLETEAVQRGVAHWEVDTEGHAEFKWNEERNGSR